MAAIPPLGKGHRRMPRPFFISDMLALPPQAAHGQSPMMHAAQSGEGLTGTAPSARRLARRLPSMTASSWLVASTPRRRHMQAYARFDTSRYATAFRVGRHRMPQFPLVLAMS